MVQIEVKVNNDKILERLTKVLAEATVHPSLEAVKALREEGLSVGLIDMPTIKPIDREGILEAAGQSRYLLSVEEHNILGGLGSAIAEVLSEEASGTKLIRHGIPDTFSLIAPPHHLYAHYKLDSDGIASVAREVIQTGKLALDSRTCPLPEEI